MISVIIPVYNVAPYLREALDSVINQTYKDLEILIIDDGSTDGSSEICDDYTSYPRVIVQHQPNLGLSTARNTGLDMITGDYVAFLDSDDAYHPDCIRSMAVAMDDADLVISKYTLNYTKGKLEQKGIVWPAIACWPVDLLPPQERAWTSLTGTYLQTEPVSQSPLCGISHHPTVPCGYNVHHENG